MGNGELRITNYELRMGNSLRGRGYHGRTNQRSINYFNKTLIPLKYKIKQLPHN